ncbi:hypothetical protein DKM44_04835 [Deinococcus irradiatisoli]|uniref:Uncharacterized protein n=1 Tax=Deinococcus irradiatisoli TaxID=2202254 RepID=A0A2Z3JH08_9DEIO|nr:hypothetical protein [Deinococcus irradiatisoli]AWN22640.1 hypothetical protein DKM44_04835 [Deinococcus irradiatisoli]
MDTTAQHRVRARLVTGSLERTEAEPTPYSVDLAAAPNPDVNAPELGPVMQLRVVQWPNDPEREREVLKTFVPNASLLRQALLAAQQGRAHDFLYPEDAPNWGVRIEGAEGEVILRRLDPDSGVAADDAFALEPGDVPALLDHLRAARGDLGEARREFFSDGDPDASDGQPTGEREH